MTENNRRALDAPLISQNSFHELQELISDYPGALAEVIETLPKTLPDINAETPSFADASSLLLKAGGLLANTLRADLKPDSANALGHASQVDAEIVSEKLSSRTEYAKYIDALLTGFIDAYENPVQQDMQPEKHVTDVQDVSAKRSLANRSKVDEYTIEQVTDLREAFREEISEGFEAAGKTSPIDAPSQGRIIQ